MNKNELLAGEQLNINFQYPAEYKKFLNDELSKLSLDNTSWWLIGTSKGFFKICYKSINIDYKSKKLLIPFAKSDDSNILACFDLSHKIWLTSCEENDVANADWDNRFHIDSFSSWLDWVIKEES